MNPSELLAMYERVADAPDAVGRLRRLVLELAVRGQLAPARDDDDSVEALFSKIADENRNRPDEARLRTRSSADLTERIRGGWEIPSHWKWVQLTAVAKVTYGFAFESQRFNAERRGMPLVRIRDISRTDTEAYFEGPFDPTYIVNPGDYLVGMDGDFNVRRWRGPKALLNQRVLRLSKWLDGAVPEFMCIPLQFVLEVIHGTTSQTTVKHLSAKQVNRIELPLPSFAEQHRIVAKVYELMALCDQLEAARKEREATRDRLATATLARLNAPNPDSFVADARFAIKVMPALTARADQVKRLRQTILNLAVRGKLVPQDPADEAVSDLIRRKRSLPSGYLRRRKIVKVTASVSSLPPFTLLPETWEWYTIQELYEQLAIIDYADGNHGSLYPRSSEFSDDGVPFVTAKDLVDGRVNWSSVANLSASRAVSLTKGWAQGGDVLLTHNATVGRVAHVSRDTGAFLLGTSVTYFRLHSDVISSDYFYHFLRSDVWQQQMWQVMEQTTRNQVSIQKQALFHVVVPPLAEQTRIVAKLEELMSLCDALEAALTRGSSRQRRLLDALLHATAQSP